MPHVVVRGRPRRCCGGRHGGRVVAVVVLRVVWQLGLRRCLSRQADTRVAGFSHDMIELVISAHLVHVDNRVQVDLARIAWSERFATSRRRVNVDV